MKLRTKEVQAYHKLRALIPIQMRLSNKKAKSMVENKNEHKYVKKSINESVMK